MSNRSKKFVFVPFCLLAQAYQAQGIVKYEWKATIKPIVQLLDNDINIIQMPCAEASFNNSLIRHPKGILKYDTDDFNKHCQNLAKQTANQIREIYKNQYEVLAVIGIEHSPSCCINYIYILIKECKIEWVYLCKNCSMKYKNIIYHLLELIEYI